MSESQRQPGQAVLAQSTVLNRSQFPALSHFFFFFNLKNLPEMQKPQLQSLGREDPLAKGMAIHSSILAWKIPWTEEPGELH